MTNTAMTTTTPHNDGIHTSLAQLFGQTINGTQVQAIEIPLFQRDYAQGRRNEQASHVRERFIADLCSALDGIKDIHLDFVFGDVVDGTLYPLDGQQRLTTLFLLHCYLSWHLPETAGVPQTWHAFHYATRPGARAFCRFLTQCRPGMDAQILPEWLRDQADYLPTWKHDPTIQGMLVVLDELHKHYRGQPTKQLRTAWQRLTDPEKPAISFLLLPVAARKLDNTLYVKMNSRGRPLTEFENFKAELEALLRQNPSIPEKYVAYFSRRIDTNWADLFWEYRGNNDLIDEEFMRYLRFLFEVQAWKRGLTVDLKHSDLKALIGLSDQLLGSRAAEARKNLRWMVQALNIWLKVEADGTSGPKAIKPLFSHLFTRDASSATTPLRIFNFGDFGDAPVGVDMFHACCELYGTRWSLAHTLLLYGVLRGLMAKTQLPDLQLRLRLLRNLIEASRSEIRADDTRNNMPALLGEVEKIMAGGPLADITTFNQVQVTNEQAKKAFLAVHPTVQVTLHRLEDHALLRGGLTAFDLDPGQSTTTFVNRAAQFHILFETPYSLVSAALLTKSNKGRGYDRNSGHRLTYLGAPRQAGPWEDHWRARRSEPAHPSATALQALLDGMATGESSQSIVDVFLANPNTPKDWRYYMTKYPAMRGEHLKFAGTYVLAPDPGYAICMLKTDSCDNRSNHHDAYLLALVEKAAITPEYINEGWPRCFPGYETEARHLRLRNSGIQIRCVDAGWALSNLPVNPSQRNVFDQVASQHPVQGELCTVPQVNGIDTTDRITIGAALLRDFIAAGL